MNARLIAILMVALCLAPAASQADDHWANVMVGGSGSSGSVIVGPNVSGTIALNCADDKQAGNCWNLVVDSSIQCSEPENVVTTVTGVRYEFVRWGKQLFFVQALLGGTHTNRDGSEKGWRDAWGAGAGIDFLTDPPRDVKEGLSEVGFRIQVDRLYPFGGEARRPAYWRFSGGMILRWYKPVKQDPQNRPASPSVMHRRLTFPTTAP